MDPLLFRSLQPNTTQVPNHFIDELMPQLSDTELRILLIVTRQTLGWIEDHETGKRKERDWISRHQLELKTGRGRTQLALAITSLIDKGIIETLNDAGDLLSTSQQRQLSGGRIYYRLKTRQPSLFDTRPKTGQVGGVTGNRPDRKPDTTKETLITKENTLRSAEPTAREGKEGKPAKEISTHRKLVDFFYEATRATRGITPIYTGADVKALKRILDGGIKQDAIEKVMIYFLCDPSFKSFSPSLKTIFSAGVINGLINRMRNEPDFWKKMDGYSATRGLDKAYKIVGDPLIIAELTAAISDIRSRIIGAWKGPENRNEAEAREILRKQAGFIINQERK